MLKRKLSIILLITLTLSLTGCTRKPEPVEPSPVESAAQMEVVDGSGNKLGQIPANATCTAYDGGIFFSLWDIEENGFTGPAEYLLYNREYNDELYLITMSDQGYEPLFCRTELDGVIYALSLVGNPFDEEPDELYLIAIDPENHTNEQYLVSNNGFPYAFMAAGHGSLYIMNHEMSEPQIDVIYAFTPGNTAVRQVYSTLGSGRDDSIRAICEQPDGFYVLWLDQTPGYTPEMWIDTVDTSFRRTSSNDITWFVLPSIQSLPGLSEYQDALNELCMYVSRFALADGRYLFYENFGMVRLIYDTVTDEVLTVKDDTYAVSLGGGSPVLYRYVYDDSPSEPEIIEIKDGSLVTTTIKPVDGTHIYLSSLSHSPNGTWLAIMSDSVSLSAGNKQLVLWSDN